MNVDWNRPKSILQRLGGQVQLLLKCSALTRVRVSGKRVSGKSGKRVSGKESFRQESFRHRRESKDR